MTAREEIADELAAMRRMLASAAVGAVSFGIEAAEEAGGAIALIHVFDAYDCKGTEAEVTFLLRGAKLPWRIVWH
jgi:hypothetical protein